MGCSYTIKGLELPQSQGIAGSYANKHNINKQSSLLPSKSTGQDEETKQLRDQAPHKPAEKAKGDPAQTTAERPWANQEGVQITSITSTLEPCSNKCAKAGQ
jgi:hypothetical protein